MKAEEFLKELEYLLQDIPEEEKRDAISYYQDYLEEAGEKQEDAVREFGSPERVAAMIRADLAGNLKEGGGFTDSGYKDERFQDPRYQVARRRELPEQREPEPSDRNSRKADGQGSSRWERFFGRRKGTVGENHEAWARRRRSFLLVGLVLVATPFLLGLGRTVSRITAGALGLLVVAVLLVGLLTGLAWIGAACALVAGLALLLADVWAGVLVIGGGVLLLGLGLVGMALSVMLYGMLLPRCIRGVVDWISRMLHRGRHGNV